MVVFIIRSFCSHYKPLRFNFTVQDKTVLDYLLKVKRLFKVNIFGIVVYLSMRLYIQMLIILNVKYFVWWLCLLSISSSKRCRNILKQNIEIRMYNIHHK